LQHACFIFHSSLNSRQLINEPFAGRALVRVLLISPFFVMPTVNALLWKNMMMNPIYGVLAQVWLFFGATPVDWLTDWPLFSIVIMVSWQWLPFATLIFVTALQSMDREQLEASRMDGAHYGQQLRYLYLPHLSRSVAVVVMIELIFLLSVFAEIFTTTGGGPGDASLRRIAALAEQLVVGRWWGPQCMVGTIVGRCPQLASDLARRRTRRRGVRGRPVGLAVNR
jgi:ABC-type sugar transport system permease subunit